MTTKQFGLSVVALGCLLTGCVAAPLAQVAASQVATPCPTGTVCQPGGSMTDMSAGLGDSIRKLTSLTPVSPSPPR